MVIKGLEHLSQEKRQRELRLCLGEEKTEEGLIRVYNCLIRGNAEDGTRLFSSVPT